MKYKKMIIMVLLMAVLLVSFGISDSEAIPIAYHPCAIGDCEFAISTSFASLCSFGTTTGTGDTFNYPYGLIGFTVASDSCPSGDSIDSASTKRIAGVAPSGTVTLIFRKSSDHTTPIDLTGFVYRKYGHTSDNNTPHWYDFMYDGTTGAVITGNQVVLHFVDGERGDDDITVNGVIVDPGGPGQPTAVPTMTEWGMIVFMLLAGLSSVYYLRRQKRAER